MDYVRWFMNDLCKTVLSHQIIQNWSFLGSIVLIKPEFIFGLKSPNTIVKKNVLKVTACDVDLKLVIKLDNPLRDWLGEWYRATSMHSLFLIFDSAVRHWWRKFKFQRMMVFFVTIDSISLDIMRAIGSSQIMCLNF